MYGSGSTRLIVGGTAPSRIAWIVAIDSIAPAAPSVCPSIDLLAVIETHGPCSPSSVARRLELGAVALGRGGRVGVDVVQLVRRHARLLERTPAGTDGAGAARRGQRDVRGVRGRAVADELREGLRAARLRVRQLLEHEHRPRPRP